MHMPILPSLRLRKSKTPGKLKTASAALLELEPATSLPATRSLPEEELLPTGPLPKRTALERLPLVVEIVRIVSVVEPCPELRIAEDLVRFVDGCHFLFRLLFADTLTRGFVRVELLGHAPVGFLDGAVVGIVGYAEDFVVVFCFGALEEGVGFLEERLDL